MVFIFYPLLKPPHRLKQRRYLLLNENIVSGTFEALHRAVAPFPNNKGVLGIARTTGQETPKAFIIYSVEIPAAIVTKIVSFATDERIPARTSS